MCDATCSRSACGKVHSDYCYSDSIATTLVLLCSGLVNIVVYAKQWPMGILPW